MIIMTTGEIISIVIAIVSVGVTIYFGLEQCKAKDEVKRLKSFLEYRKLEKFANDYRETLKSYRSRITRPNWDKPVKGKDLVGDISDALTGFNSYLPKMEPSMKEQLTQTIDEANREFAKVRKGDEFYRDANLKHLDDIDRLLNEELVRQSKEFTDLL